MNTQKPRSGFVCWTLALAVLLAAAFAAPPGSLGASIPGLHTTLGAPAPDALPQLRGIVQGVSGIVQLPAENKLEIQQDEEKAIIEWDSFDIGRDAWTHFDQQGNSDWVALNRIYDLAPSRIFGRLTADGRIYLINQNGILFGPESTVNVHSLIGSTLNITNEDFLNDTLRFKAENYMDPGSPVNPDAFIMNQGLLQTDEIGSLLLLAPVVENAGTLESPSGRVGLVAGVEVTIGSGGGITLTDSGGAPNRAVNTESGRLIADTGRAGMYGREVYQDGLIRSITAVKKEGRIELRATEKVVTGANSRTTCAITDSAETAHTSFPFEGGRIEIGGLDDANPVPLIEHWGEITAPAGTVRLLARDRVFLGSGSRIDVSGSWSDLPAEARILTLRLNSNELRDEQVQKGGLLQGEEIAVDETAGSTIGDLSSHLDSEEVAARERSAYGGDVIIRVTGPSGDIILKEGSQILFSGGGIRYAEGYVETTKLLAGRRIYDISEAPDTMTFDRVMGLHEDFHERYNITETFEGLFFGGASPVKDFVAAHTEGRDAGTLTLMASRIVLDGEIRGDVTKGILQTEAEDPEDENGNAAVTGRREPAGGTLIIGDPMDDNAVPADRVHDFVVDQVLIQADTDPVAAEFGADPAVFPFPEEREGKTVLSAEILNAAGLSNLQIYTNGLFETAPDAEIALRPGNRKEGWVDEDNKPIGRFYAIAGNILHQGSIEVPAGTIRMVMRDTVTDFPEGEKKVVLAEGSRLSTAGERIDNSLASWEEGASLRTGHIHGGHITVHDGTVAQDEGVFVCLDALIDVSGGYAIDETGKVKGGDGGTLDIAGPSILLLGDVRGHSMPGNEGGTLRLTQDEVSVLPFGIWAEFVDQIRAAFELTKQNSMAALDLINRARIAYGMDPISIERFKKEQQILEDRLVQLEKRDLVSIGPLFFKSENDTTGFSHIELASLKDLVVFSGANLQPSWAKLPIPKAGDDNMSLETPIGISNSYISDNLSGLGVSSVSKGFLLVQPAFAGNTSITLKAGQKREFSDVDEDVLNLARLRVDPGARIHTAPEGRIILTAPGVDVDGELKALSGDISITATFADLRLGPESRILAMGYNKWGDAPLEGLEINYDPQPGGNVTLSAGTASDAISGNLILEPGSLVDVSGSQPVEKNWHDNPRPEHLNGTNIDYKTKLVASGLGVVAEKLSEAGTPGSIELAYRGTLTLEGDLSGHAQLDGLPGGALTISHLNTRDPASLLRVTAGQFTDFMDRGFDDLTFRSVQRIALEGPMDVDVARRLTLDAPHIEGLGSGPIRLAAPWIRIANTRGEYRSQEEYDNILARPDLFRTASLELVSGWLDLEGSVLLTGFRDVRFTAENDIRMTERYYQLGIESPKNHWEGLLKTAANLTLDASRIYPATLSDFTVQGGDRVTILPGGRSVEGPVLSAGGSLTIEAGAIDHWGVLAAPYGRIALRGDPVDGEVAVHAGSVIQTAGEVPVLYGSLDDRVWRVPDKTAAPNALGIEITDLPEKSIEITGNRVVLHEGSEMDVSGGGLLFSYLFEPGLSGSEDPLTRPGRYVIMPDASISLPGDAVYLEGGNGIAEGVYSLLPAWCAFLPGAVVITDLAAAGSGYDPGQRFSPEGYPVVAGHATVMGTGIEDPRPSGYAIRPAFEVLAEGDFRVAEAEAGAAGDVAIHGETVALSGKIAMASLPHYRGGTIALSGRNIAVGTPTDGFAAGLVLDPSFFENMDLEEIRIGDKDLDPAIRTQEIRMYSGTLNAPRVSLSANGDVTLMPGAEIHALDEAIRLDRLVYQYDYDPQVGLGVLTPQGMEAPDDGASWQAQVLLRTAAGPEILELEGDGDSVTGILYDGAPELPAGLDVPAFHHAGIAGGRGMADLASGGGTIRLKTRSVVHASHEVGLDGRVDLEEGAVVESDHSTLTLAGSIITFVPAGHPGGPDGLFLTQGLWAAFGSFDDITLKSRSDLVFLGDFDLSAEGRLTIDAARIAGTDGDETVRVYAPEMRLVNTGAASTQGGILEDDQGLLTVAGDTLEIGMAWLSETESTRRITMDGFSDIHLAASRDAVFAGKGTLDTGRDGGSTGGDLTLTAGRVTTALYESAGDDGGVDYGTTKITMDVGERTVTFQGNGSGSVEDAAAGGRLEVLARDIALHGARVEMPSGILALNATNSIRLGNGSIVDLRGTETFPGGIAEMHAAQGALNVEAGSRIDVSAGAQGDAGEVALSAPVGGMTLDGDLHGASAGGAGGSFRADALEVADLNGLSARLQAGGFTERVSVRSRTGDLVLGSAGPGGPDVEVTARDYRLTADSGDIVVHENAAIDASGDDRGGCVELYAGDDLRLDGGIRAAGTGAGSQGGEVVLSAAHRGGSGKILLDGARIDVSGEGEGGSVLFRVGGAGQTEATDIHGTVLGASRVEAETVTYYERSGNIGAMGTFAFPAPGDFAHSLTDGTGAGIGVARRTGMEIWSAEGVDLTLNQAWNLGSSNPGGKPGVLTIRSGGNLTINADLQDSRTAMSGLFTDVEGPDTWDIRLVAGADPASADPMAVRSGEGDLTVSNQKVVYTENADIQFASGRDTILLHGKQTGLMINSTMTYNLGTYRGEIRGAVGRDLRIGGTGSTSPDLSGGIQTALGDIEIDVGRDLRMQHTDTTKSVGIRTTGGAPRVLWHPEYMDPETWPEEHEDILSSLFKAYPSFLIPRLAQSYLDSNIHKYYHEYTHGGDITLRVGGHLRATGTQAFSGQAWDYSYQGGNWGASYEHVTGGVWPTAPVGGLAAMGGGDLSVRTGGRFESKAGTFGTGDLSIFAAGDLDGQFLVAEGSGELAALGDFGLNHHPERTIELFDARIAIAAQGNALIGEALNPTSRKGLGFFELRYAEDASLAVTALLGDVTLPTGGLFPPTLEIEAGGDIHVEDKVILAPSRTGQLRLEAGGDIDGLDESGGEHAEILVSDLAPEAVYATYPRPTFEYTDSGGNTETITYQPTRDLVEGRYNHGFPSERPQEKPGSQDYFAIHRAMMDSGMALVEDPEDRAFFENVSGLLAVPVHAGDTAPVEIRAGGRIQDIAFVLPKQARISAGGTIEDIYYLGQHTGPADLSVIQAGRDILFHAEPVGAVYQVGIEQAGPGYLAVQAGNRMDLGETRGIKSIGDVFNGYVGTRGSSLIVMSGLHGDMENDGVVEEIDALFQDLRAAGMEFSVLMAEGKAEEARAAVDTVRDESLAPFMEGYSQGQGDIDMITSQIGSDAEDSDLFILARGEINVGRSAFFSDEDDRGSTGIYTALGGGVNIFSRGDVNVNESRIMTYMGGDITIWSDEGNINAGKGSKAAINVDPPKITWVGGIPVIKFIPPAVGSGIRCLTYDPDGFEGPQKPPQPGDIYLTAPEGVIDAGEAGIAGGNLFLGATQVLNAQNIEATGMSVGVPTASQGTAGLSSLAGSGSLAGMGDMGEEQAAMASRRGEAAQDAERLAESFLPKWLDVKVIAFDELEEEESKE